MHPVLRNILAVLVGFIAGSLVNMGLITVSPLLIPPPQGVDVRDAASLALSIHRFEPRHFLMPFLAHALGTLVGALLAFKLGATRRRELAYGVGVLFLCGGIAASFMIPAPGWFIALDVVGAYLPMAWLAVRLLEKR